MPITPTRLRADLYNLLDEALETGKPIEILRKGQVLRLVPPPRVSRLSRLKKRKTIVGDPEDLVSIDWSKEWKPYL